MGSFALALQPQVKIIYFMDSIMRGQIKKDHTADYQSLLCGLSRLLAPLEDVTQKLLFQIIPK